LRLPWQRWPGRISVVCCALLSALSALGGCTSLPTGQDPGSLARHSTGRLALRVDGDAARSMSAGFELRGDAQSGLLALSTPLGTQLARATWQAGRIELDTGDSVRRYHSLDELSEDAFGQALPMAALFDWLKGRAWAGAPYTSLADEPGYLQLGWEVRLGRLGDGLIVANRLTPAPAISVRIKLDPN
jgi:outer membrane lipoprotein LolB